ncbi:chaperonin 10-like protein [Suillus fuscotomentosus]|uniref:Chaperonin 10-like protein n=1 Tax=Suillus fuscotomentosus TaxID=1912939 RepID=A0AAD4E1E6_9AGAM|nr:chaperonin 10-like protein [Suillus fuscotomentosus]KAG1896508.1 chaperonin 10-like protein [Suillus fuscotomentosus]
MPVCMNNQSPVLPQKQGNFELSSRSIPNPGVGQLLIKIQSAALNPVDYKIQDTEVVAIQYPAVLGTDIAGTVEELGEGVENFRKGDRVSDNSLPVVAHGKFTNDFTAFQQYTLTATSFTANIPASESFDSAATIPVGLDTALVGLYGKHYGAGVTPPWTENDSGHESKKPIVILGGSSSGFIRIAAIQLARLSGFYPIITTASASNEELVKGYGATHFFDRSLSGKQLLAAISEVTDDPIKLVYDAISLPETQSVGWELLADNGTLILTLYAKPSKYEVLPNGLEGIIGGLERLRLGQVSGTKLVAHPQETQ